ncbi:MAG: hypothetical protein R2862_10930 [Thermoanaerobaculia bacterium]
MERARAVMAREFTLAGATLEAVDRSQGAAVRVDAEQMQQLLMNLLQNALAATEENRGDRRSDRGPARRSAGLLRGHRHRSGISEADRARSSRSSIPPGAAGPAARRSPSAVARAHGGEIQVGERARPGTPRRAVARRYQPSPSNETARDRDESEC